ncbi:MAG TPA: response regulator transcription factor [Gemmatimonadaceae bacterium]|jgi:two-component system copper resistance phosphate regulon response regulator CusR
MSPALSSVGPSNESSVRHVLLVYGDSHAAGVLAMGLLDAAIHVTIEQTVSGALTRALYESFDAIVADDRLPGSDARDLCRQLREHKIRTPIIVITKDSVGDRSRAMAAGADAALAGVASVQDVLQAAARAVARTAARPAEAERILVGDLEIDLRQHTVRRGATTIVLTKKEFSLLAVLAQRSGQVVDRATLAMHLWQDVGLGSSNQLDVLVGRLRRKIDAAFESKLVQTHRSLGYKLTDPERVPFTDVTG